MPDRHLRQASPRSASTLTGDVPLQDVLDHLTEQIVALLPVTGAGVLLVDGDAGHRVVSATDDQLRRVEGVQVELGEGPCLTAHDSDRTVAVVDLSTDVRYPRFSPVASEAGWGAVFSFPLRQAGRRIGALELYASEPVVLTATELDRGQTLADVAASYLTFAGRRAGAVDTSLAVVGRERRIDADLAEALEADALHLVYQPIVDGATGRWTGMEALLRWDHDRLGALAPTEILAGAERRGLTLALARWIARTACGDLQRMRDRSGLVAPAVVCVNVSFAELLHPGHAAMVAQTLAATGLPATSLVLEVTEHVPLADQDEAARQLRDLAGLGVVVALDDFGTGYSSLAHLQVFPVDVLKLDRSFVTRIGHDATDEAIAGAVVALARDLGITVIAEGIETAEQLAHIHALGIERSQGYLHLVPVRADAFESLLVAGPAASANSMPPPASATGTAG